MSAEPAPPRFRCVACGNLTRFDVTITRQERSFHHYSIGGELSIDERQVLDERLDAVSCRWCGHGRAVEHLGLGEPSGGRSQGTGSSDPGDSPGGHPGDDSPGGAHGSGFGDPGASAVGEAWS